MLAPRNSKEFKRQTQSYPANLASLLYQPLRQYNDRQTSPLKQPSLVTSVVEPVLTEWRRKRSLSRLSSGGVQVVLTTVCTVTVLVVLLFVIYRILVPSPPKPHHSKSDFVYHLPTSSPQTNLQYALMVDAGSSGSRLYIYSWPRDVPASLPRIRPVTDERGNPQTKKITPGLSSFSDDPKDSLDYIEELLEFAKKTVPYHEHENTPLYILATAGMRLLDKGEQTGILKALIRGIPKRCQFIFSEKNIQIISGTQEGVYQWVAINYALNRFQHNSSSVADRPPTVGIMDMGGASMQVAFEVRSPSNIQDFPASNSTQVIPVTLAPSDCGKSCPVTSLYYVYVTTFLGYGANEKLTHHQEQLVAKVLETRSETVLGTSSGKAIRDPCLPLNMVEEVELDPTEFLSKNASSVVSKEFLDEDTWYFVGTGDWSKCRMSLLPLVRGPRRPDISCVTSTTSSPPASFSSATRTPASPPCELFPKLMAPPVNFAADYFYGFSEFWYTMDDVLRIGGSYNREKFSKASEDFCRTDWSTMKARFDQNLYPKADLHRLKYQCFKSAWVATALHDGMKFPKNFQNLQSSPNEVNGHAAAWALGAILLKSLEMKAVVVPFSKKTESVTAVGVGESWSPSSGNRLYSVLSPSDSLRPENVILFLCIAAVMGVTGYLMYRLKSSSPNYKLLPTTGPTPSSMDLKAMSDEVEEGLFLTAAPVPRFAMR